MHLYLLSQKQGPDLRCTLFAELDITGQFVRISVCVHLSSKPLNAKLDQQLHNYAKSKSAAT